MTKPNLSLAGYGPAEPGLRPTVAPLAARCACDPSRESKPSSGHAFTRRGLLGSALLSAGGLLLAQLAAPKTALGAGAARRKFVFAYFEGGWDLLLGLDPRDPRTTTAGTHQIEVGYDQLGAPYRDRGVQRRGGLAFGPAVPPELLAHAGSMSIVNAISMDTASHEVGRRYFITGRFPRGIAAVGSSTPSEIVAQLGDQTPIPHVSAGVEAYSTGLPSYAAPLVVNSVSDLLVALTPFFQMDDDVKRAVEAYQDQGLACGGRRLDRDGLASTAIRSQARARGYLSSHLDRAFDLTRTDAEMTALRTLYGMDGGAIEPDGPEVLAFVAAQAVKKDIATCVSVRVANALDTHANWAQDHAPRQERGWKALAALLSDLAGTPSSSGTGSVLDETTILAFSEFGRTPMFNNLRGRDHFLGSSCLLAGAGIKKGLTIGKSASVGMLPLGTRLATGEGVESPTDIERDMGLVVPLSPKHVIATVLTSAGLDASYLRTPPIAALLA